MLRIGVGKMRRDALTGTKERYRILNDIAGVTSLLGSL